MEDSTETALQDWLGNLKLLHGVPFNYLVPNDAMLPPESIRFFFCDSVWLDALIEGALSLGRSTQGELQRDCKHAENFHRLAQQGRREKRKKLFGHLRNHMSADAIEKLDAAPFTPSEKVTGFLLRSGVVKGWPGLEVQGFSDSAFSKPCQMLRMDHIGPDVLLCLFEGILQSVRFHEHPEVLHFGVDPSTTRFGTFTKGFRYPVTNGENQAGSNVPTTLAPPISVSDFLRVNKINAPGVLKMHDLALAMGSELNTKVGYTGPFTSAEFALEMIEGVQAVDFTIQAIGVVN